MSAKCYQYVTCFAKSQSGDGEFTCTILTRAINNRPCPFAKEKRTVTNGIEYPDIPNAEYEKKIGVK